MSPRNDGSWRGPQNIAKHLKEQPKQHEMLRSNTARNPDTVRKRGVSMMTISGSTKGLSDIFAVSKNHRQLGKSLVSPIKILPLVFGRKMRTHPLPHSLNEPIDSARGRCQTCSANCNSFRRFPLKIRKRYPRRRCRRTPRSRNRRKRCKLD